MDTKIKLPSFNNIINRSYCFASAEDPHEVNVIYGLQGDFKPEIFQRALWEVFTHTPILRTQVREGWMFTRRRYVKDLGKYSLQDIFRFLDKPAVNIDPAQGPVDGDVKKYLLEEKLDLSHKFPLHFCLIKKSAQEWILIYKMHHSAYDGVGSFIIMSKIMQEYNTLLGKPNQKKIPDEPADYAYVDKLKQYLAKEGPGAPADLGALLALPVEHLRDVNEMGGEKRYRYFFVEGQRYEKLMRFSKESGFTVNHILVTLINRVLHRILKKRNQAKELIRLEQPVDLRRYIGVEGGITNYVVPFYTHFMTRNLETLPEALCAVKKEMKKVFREKSFLKNVLRMNMAKISTTKTMKRMTPRIEKSLFYNPSISSALSNAGQVDQIIETPAGCEFQYCIPLPRPAFYGYWWVSASTGKVLNMSIPYLFPVMQEETIGEMIDLFLEDLDQLLDLDVNELKELEKKEVVLEQRQEKPQEEKINYKVNFLLLFLGRLVSDLGTKSFAFALSLYVIDLTKSALQFSAVLALSLIPQVLVNVLGGVFVDKHNKKKIIVITDLLTGVVTVGFMFLFMHFTGLYQTDASFQPHIIFVIAGVGVAISLIQSYFGLAISASVPNIVHESNVQRAMSVFHGIDSVVTILGPVLGAVLYALFKNNLEIVFLINGLSFILSGISEMFIRFHRVNHTMKQETTSYFGHFKEGVKYILNQKALAFTMLFLALINFIVAPLAYNVLPFLTYHIMQISEYQLSFIQGAFAVGGILGAMWVGLAKSNAQMVRKFFKAVAMQGVLVCLWIFPDIGIISLEQKKLITLLFAGITFFMGIFHSLQSIPFVAYYQVKVEERYRARVFGALRTAIMILTPIGIMIYGVFLDSFREYWATIIFGTGLAVVLLSFVYARTKTMKKFMREVKD